MLKAIVCDMDGTLLDDNDVISESNRQALLKAQEKGVRLILASGRAYTRLLKYAKLLNMDQYQGYLIDINGTSILDCQSLTRNYVGGMEQEDMEILLDKVVNLEYEAHFNCDDAVICYLTPHQYEVKKAYRIQHQIADDVPWNGAMGKLIVDLREGYPNSKLITTLDEKPKRCNKVTFSNYLTNLDDILESLRTPDILDKYNLLRSHPQCLEIVKKSISKGNALRKVLALLKIEPHEVVVFGDGENDVSMFLEGAHSVAMGNAPDYVKKYAKEITQSNNESGIAVVVNRLLNQQEENK